MLGRIVSTVIVTLALVVAARSDDALKCYMCNSLVNPGCDSDPQAHNLQPVECTLNKMIEYQKAAQQHSGLNGILSVFDLDNLQHFQIALPKMACSKMVFKIDGLKDDVTVRSCQAAKTDTIDTCKTLKAMYSNDKANMLHCDLCMHDTCNGSYAPSAKVFFVFLSVVGTLALGALYHGA